MGEPIFTMITIPVHAYHHPVTVAGNDIDALGHVNNVVYVRWAQEAAEAHWLERATDEMKSAHRWVVLRHEIEYKAPAFLNETLTCSTWVVNLEGARSQRQVIIHRDGVLLAEVLTTWCLLDALSMKPRRISDDFRGIFLR